MRSDRQDRLLFQKGNAKLIVAAQHADSISHKPV